jgi:hypothetical protein
MNFDLRKRVANYRAGTGTRRCVNCLKFLPPSSCRTLGDDISPVATCKHFEGRPEETKESLNGTPHF